MQILTKMMRPPPPTPWIALPTINIAVLTLRAQIRLPTRKTMFATRMIGFLPQISLSLPHRGTEAAFARRYAEPIHVYPASETLKCDAMVGRAVVMIYHYDLASIPLQIEKENVTVMSSAAKNTAIYVQGGQYLRHICAGFWWWWRWGG